jgi:VRR-NUC domain.
MKSEKQIQDEIRIALSDHGVVFRTNAGEFYQGKMVYSQEFKQRVLINLRVVQGLPIGFSDLLFIGDGYTAFIETKRLGETPKPEQLNFINRMVALHHRAGVARNVEEALRIIL